MTYNEIENRIQSGDIILFSGQRLYQKIIQYISKSKWNHIGVIFESYGHLFLIEAVGSGVQIRRFKQACDGHRNSIRIIRPQWRYVNQNFDLIRNILDNIGNDYDFKGVLAFLIRTIYPKFRWQNKTSQFCSELIAHALENVNYRWTAKPSHLVKPCDFDQIENFNIIIDSYQTI